VNRDQIHAAMMNARLTQADIDSGGWGDPCKARIDALEAENVVLRAVEVAAREESRYCHGIHTGLRAALAALDATRVEP
jgi:hypothetical protein